MSVAASFETIGAVVATAAVAVAAVWLTGDPRAFGVVVALAGLAVGTALARQEWRASHPRRADGTPRHARGRADIGKAA